MTNISVKSRKITVKGPKGEIVKDLSHLPIDFIVGKNQEGLRTVTLQTWQARYKQKCTVKTATSLIKNMIQGVIYGYRYKMRLVHAHFPIKVAISKDKKQITIKNFLGK